MKTVPRGDSCLDKEDGNEGHAEWQAEQNSLTDWIFTTHAHVLSHSGHVHCFAIPWTEALQAPLSILQARILKWVAMPSFGGSS